MLCAKYHEAGLCGSREKCDRNNLVSKFAYVHNIQSHVKQDRIEIFCDAADDDDTRRQK